MSKNERKQTPREPITVQLTIIPDPEPSPEYLALWRRLLAPIEPETTPSSNSTEKPEETN